MRRLLSSKSFSNLIRQALCLLAVTGVTNSAFAVVLNETFSTRNYFNSGTAILNQATNLITPPLQVAGYQPLCGISTTSNVDFGDGRHGSFDSSTYSLFGTYSSPYIYINTDLFPILYVTNFNLNAGDIIQPVGSHALVIKSLSDITVSGTIDCSGGVGQAANASATNMSSGGVGRCGGGSGGNGGTTGTPATAGGLGEASASITSGSGATNTNGSGGGGGGGFYMTGVCAGNSGIHGAAVGGGANGGAAGANFLDPAFTLPGGGAGGGGGGPSATWSGAGGGGGGGHIELLAFHNVNLGAGSLVSANGGNGGSSANNSGGGGGGAGGSIKIFAGNSSSINATAGVHVQNGTAGTSGSGSAGGVGAWGRVWVINSAGSGATAQVDQADTALISTGNMQYATGTFTMTSSAYDLNNYHTTISSMGNTVVNSGSGTIAVTVGGSRGGFAQDDSGFLAAASASSLSGSRYLRFNVSINNTIPATPIELSQISVVYTPGPLNNLNYTSACGTLIGTDQFNFTDPEIILFLLILLIPVAVLFSMKRIYQLKPTLNPSR